MQATIRVHISGWPTMQAGSISFAGGVFTASIVDDENLPLGDVTIDLVRKEHEGRSVLLVPDA